jgi:multiple sugar transport system substrate-binding protein
VLAKDPALKYEVVPIPGPQAGATPVAPLGGETWTIPRTGNKDREAKAAKIVECLNTDASQMALATTRSTVPTKSSLIPQFVAKQPNMAAFSTAVQTARARTGELGAEWPKAATRIYTAVQKALTGGAAPLAALQQAQSG